MYVKSLLLGCLLGLMLFTVSCDTNSDDLIDLDFADETEFQSWVNSHNWGVGASVISGNDSNMVLDVVMEYYQDYSDIDFAADYSLLINGVECVVIADAANSEVRVWDVEVPYADKLHFVFKIDDVVIIDRIVPFPDEPVFYDTYLTNFSQDIPFHWTLEDDAQVQFLHGFVWDNDAHQYISKLLPDEARTFILPANTFTSNWVYYCGFTVEEANYSEHHNNLAFVTTHDFTGYILVKNHDKTEIERKSAARYLSPFRRKRADR